MSSPVSSSPPTSPNPVLRFLRKSLDNPDVGGSRKNAGQPQAGGFRAKFRRPRLKRATTLPVELEAPDEKDALVDMSEDRSARDVGLPTGTRFVESDTISRATSRSLRTRTSSVRPSSDGHGSHLVVADSVDDVVDFAVASTAASGAEGTPTTVQRSLARKIQNLLSSVPPFYGSDGTSTPNNTDSAPPGPGTTDSILKLLSSANVMNGTWGILDRLISTPKKDDKSNPGSGAAHDEGDSLMIYGPLIIDASSTVELARSEVVSMSVEVTEEITHSAHDDSAWWPFGGHNKEPPKDSFERRRSIVIQDVTVWYPSLTKVSIKCSWWGFRLYLPEPVMLILDQKELQTAQRAAMITTALTWIINNVPTAAMSPPLLVVVQVLKGLVPLIGYIAGFIAWSWGQIKGFDRGQGVVLSATWLLPIALIPGAWDGPPPPPVPDPVPTPTPAPTEPAPTTPAPADPTTPTPAPAPTCPAPQPTQPVVTDPAATPTPVPVPISNAKKGWFGK
ncbi:hypothetical protein EXIGLDRAFT_836758 [Exidia glandulosa HHB12029]|uniref:Uncharacterized protein n=1 Tax=Exidia glandulosa HHB12029 TaxID=1314781 RepID=A0A166AHT1_EXIGL|nr:hypothetical protein EXIGLDRAFT_836738 [Exidia glandulosa HHB12029]KZV91999.1 hypothetical protein EXIGLDRAFT_836758 [Exidia glandulosa HHB12029]